MECYSSTVKLSAGEPKKINNTRYYEILGVSTDASPADLKVACGKAAIKIHTNKGGDSEKLNELDEAYQVLSNPLKRKIYDQYGEGVLKKVGRTSRGPQKWKMLGEDIVLTLLVPLEDLYTGSQRSIPYKPKEICSNCNGKGIKSGPSVKCPCCQGSGMKVRIVDLGPPPTQRTLLCYQCKGTGEAIRENINDENCCEICKGDKLLQVNEVLNFDIEKGMQNGQLIKFPIQVFKSGRGAFFMIQQKEHHKFKRKGDDLFVEHTLSLKEALTGFKFELARLDGTLLEIESRPGEVIKPGQVKVIDDEGMPVYGSPFKKGKLHIRFTVEFPDSMPDRSRQIEDITPRHDLEKVETATSPRGVR